MWEARGPPIFATFYSFGRGRHFGKDDRRGARDLQEVIDERIVRQESLGNDAFSSCDVNPHPKSLQGVLDLLYATNSY
jgi:hypothetical protein